MNRSTPESVRATFQIEDPESVIVTLEPDVAARDALAVEGEIPADDLHLTLLRLGAPPDTLDMGLIATIMDAEAVKWGPMQGTVSGIGFFGSEGFDGNTVALVDVDGLAKFRTMIEKAFKAAGIPVDETYNFVPHITLAKGPVTDPESRVGTPVMFGDLAVRGQDQVALWSLKGTAEDEQPPSAEAPVEEAVTAMAYEIIEDSEDCAAQTEGAATVAVAQVDEAGTVIGIESCHADRTAAEERVAALTAAEESPATEQGDMLPAEAASVIEGLEELARAAELADRVRDALGLLSTLSKIELAVAEPQAEAVEASEDAPSEEAEFTAIRSHSTGTTDDPFDGPGEEVKVISPNDEAYFADIFAWRDDEADTTVKSSYKFIHHHVGADGTPGAASVPACSTGIGVLNGGRGGTTIPQADRQGVYDHLARHLRDADREPPELMSQDAYELALAKSNEELAAELAVPVEEGGLAGMTDEDLIAELARRWARDLAAAVTNDNEAEFAPLPEIEVEVEMPEDEMPEGMETCPMCEGEGMIEHNGLEAPCPMCEGTGYVEAPETEEEGSPLGEIPGPGAGMEAALEDEVDAEAPVADEAFDTSGYDWEGVLIVEGIPSGDGRQIAEGALTWRELPIPLMLQTVNAPGHDGAVIAGSIHHIERDGQNVMGYGYFDSGDAGSEARRLLTEGTMRGVSADIDSVIVEFITPEGQQVGMEDLMFGGVEALEVLVEGRIMGATLTPFPAFQEAHVKVIDLDGDGDLDVVLVASGAETIGSDLWRVPSPIGAWVPGQGDPAEALKALVASAASTVEVPASPPRAWFEPGVMEQPEPFTVHADGRVYGLVARWGTCHIGFTDRCVQVPRTGSAYKHFRNKNVLTAEGDLVATGPIFMDTVHPDLRLRASDTQAFYADTGCAVADVALYENEHGIVAAGALRPGLTPEQVRRFRGSDVSPDWRQIGGRLEVVGLLSVNVSGFIVEGLVASGAAVPNARGVWDSTQGDLTSLVAAGMVRKSTTEMESLMDEVAALRAEVAEMREAFRPIRAERAAERFARLAKAFPATKAVKAADESDEDGETATETHGCGGSCGGADGACACGS